MRFSWENVFYDPGTDRFVPQGKVSITDKAEIAHPLSVTLQPILPDPAGNPLSSLSPLSAVTTEPDWRRLIKSLASWNIRRFHLAQADTLRPTDLRTTLDVVREVNGYFVLSLDESTTTPEIDLPAPSRIHISVSHTSSQERLDFLGRLIVSGHRLRALTILDPNYPELLSELGSELAVRGIEEWTISPPFGSPDAHWLFDPSSPEPSFITQLKEQFPWMRIEHACFPIREGNLIVQSSGAVFTTNPVTARRDFLGWLHKMSLNDLLNHADFDQVLHLMSWLQLPDEPVAETSPTTADDEACPFDAFVAYDRSDWEEVKDLVALLKEAGVRSWVDKLNLRPGGPWLEGIDEIIDRIPVMLLIIGETGTLGAHQKREIAVFQQSLKTRPRPLIPVLLKSAPDEVKLPPGVDTYNRIDLKERDPDPFDRLVWGITGRKPRHSLG